MFIVEGNIGAGKSTFLKLINTHFPHITVAFEPLHNWQSKVYGQSILTNFYKNPKRWAYTMETLTMACRVQEHMKEQNHADQFRLMERSIYSGRYCFAQNGYENGFLTTLEWNLYLEWFNFLVTDYCKPPHGFIYLKVDPEISFERIKKRNRHSEKNITLTYLKQINKCHEEFLINKTDILPDLQSVPVLILDCNQDFETDHQKFIEHAHVIQNFILMHAPTNQKSDKQKIALNS